MHRYMAAVVLFAAVFLTTYCFVVVHHLADRIDLDVALDAPAVASQIFARPLSLEPGLVIERDLLRDHLDRLRYRRVSTDDVGAGEYRVRGLGIVIGARPVAQASASSRTPARAPGRASERASDYDGPFSVRFSEHAAQAGEDRIERIADASGRSLDGVYLPPESLARVHGDDWVERRPAALADMPAHLIDAVLSVEDRRFFTHHGLDLYRTAGAMAANLRSGRVVEGGSTLTQQLVKNLYLSWDRALGRKALEAVISLLLERRLSKEQILEAYLNEAYLGQHGPASVRGVGAAAFHYFGKTVADLDVADAALIAGLIHAPGRYAPFRKPLAAKARRDQVLSIMLSAGVIAHHTYRRAIQQPLGLVSPPSGGSGAPYFVDYVRRELSPHYSRERMEREGLSVMTTLDPRLQRLAARAVKRGLQRLEADFGSMRRESSPLQAALVALDPATGDILAMVGGREYRRSQFNRAVDAYRHPGSAFKPFVALAALSRRGDALPDHTLTTLVADAPLAVADPSGTWRPQNYDREFRGMVTVRTALEQSLNVPMARIGLDIGPERVAATARALGITSRLDAYPSIVLGATEVSLLEMTRAYATLAGGGLRPSPRAVRAVRGGAGAELVWDPAPLRRVVAEDEAYLVTSALRGVVSRGTGKAVREHGYHGPLAAKTGTSDEYRDGWFMAYTPDLVVGVRVGYDDDASVGLPARVVAVPMFSDFIVAALGRDGGRDFVVPTDIEAVDVRELPGLVPGSAWDGEPELFLAGTAPRNTGAALAAATKSDEGDADTSLARAASPPSRAAALTGPMRRWLTRRAPNRDRRPAPQRDAGERRRFGGMRPSSHRPLSAR